jgi:ketosteroid isomerase-like protein
LLSFGAFASDEADQAIHTELRGVLSGLEQAVNNEKYDDIATFFHEKLHVTTINQEVISSRPEISAYFNKWFGANGYLKKVHMTLTADKLTELYGDKTYGVVSGSGVEDYILADGRKFGMNTRWTATVIKDSDGKWKILTLHLGTDFLDNPILAKAESSLMTFAGAGLALGILIGCLVMFLLGRRKKTAP